MSKPEYKIGDVVYVKDGKKPLWPAIIESFMNSKEKKRAQLNFIRKKQRLDVPVPQLIHFKDYNHKSLRGDLNLRDAVHAARRIHEKRSTFEGMRFV